MKQKILLTGIGGPAGINAAKLFEKYKDFFYVIGCDINPHSAGQFFVDKFVICERVSDEEKYLNWIRDFVIENKINVVIPTVAEELILINKVKDYSGCENINIIVSTQEVLNLCDHKNKLYEWMSNFFPLYMEKWFFVDNKANLSFDADDYFIKPIKGRGSRGCRIVSKKELIFLKDNSREQIVAMEILPGKEWTVDAYVNRDGSFAYIVPRLRLGLSGGISSIGKTDKNEKVIRQTKEVLEKMNCYGPVFVQWKEDVYGEPKMVEINPRLSGGVTITALAGADPIQCLKSELIDEKQLHDVNWKEITVSRYFEEKIVL
jgi:carbamoyl-phosphate synthase large subunit